MTIHFKFQECRLGLLVKEVKKVGEVLGVKRKINRGFSSGRILSKDLYRFLRNQPLIFSREDSNQIRQFYKK